VHRRAQLLRPVVVGNDDAEKGVGHDDERRSGSLSPLTFLDL